jgi:hypothetical protein
MEFMMVSFPVGAAVKARSFFQRTFFADELTIGRIALIYIR